MPEKPFSFGDVVSLHQAAIKHSPGQFASMPIGTFADLLNLETKSSAFDAGKKSGFGELVARGSTTIDKLTSPVGKPLGSLGGSIFSGLFGDEYRQMGQESFEAMPRSLAEIGAGAALGPVGAVAGGLSAAANAYTETGKVGPAIVSGVTTPFVGPAMHLGGKAAGRQVAKWTADWSPRLGRIMDVAGESFGANVTGAVIGEAQRQAASVAGGGGLQPIFTKEHGVEMLGTQLPFMALDAIRAIRQPKAGEFRSSSEQANALEFAKQELEKHAEAVELARQAANRVAETAKKDSGVPRENFEPAPLEKANAVVKAPTASGDEQIVNTAMVQSGPVKKRRLNIEDAFPMLVEKTKDPAKAYTMIRATHRGRFEDFKAKYEAFVANMDKTPEAVNEASAPAEYVKPIADLQDALAKGDMEYVDQHGSSMLADDELPAEVRSTVSSIMDEALAKSKPKKHMAEQFELPIGDKKDEKKPTIDVSASEEQDPFSKMVPPIEEGRQIKSMKTGTVIGTGPGEVPFSVARETALKFKGGREKLVHEPTGTSAEVVDTGSSLFMLDHGGDPKGSDVLLSRLMRKAKKEGKPILVEEDVPEKAALLKRVGFEEQAPGQYAWNPTKKVPVHKTELKRGKGETFASSRGGSQDQLRAQLEMVLRPEDFPMAQDVETAAAQTARALDLLHENALLGMREDVVQQVRDDRKNLEATVKNLVRQGHSPVEAIHIVYRGTMKKLEKAVRERIRLMDDTPPPKSFGVPEETLQRVMKDWDKVPPHITMALSGLLDSATVHNLRAADSWADTALDITMIAAHKFSRDEKFRKDKIGEWLKLNEDRLVALRADAEYYHEVGQKERSFLTQTKDGGVEGALDKPAQERVALAEAVKSRTSEEVYQKLVEMEAFRWVAAKWFGQTLRKIKVSEYSKQSRITPEAQETGKLALKNEDGEVVLHSLQELSTQYLDADTFIEANLQKSQNDMRAAVGFPAQTEIAEALKKMGKQRLQQKTMVKLMRLIKAFYEGDIQVRYSERGDSAGQVWYSYKGGDMEALGKLLSDQYSTVTPKQAQNFMAENVMPVFQTLWNMAETRRLAGRKAPYITQELTTDLSGSLGLPDKVVSNLESIGVDPAWFEHKPGATAEDSYSIFLTSFKDMGYDDGRASLLASVAVKTAEVFRNVGKVHVGEVVGKAARDVGGIYVGLNDQEAGMAFIKSPGDLSYEGLEMKLYSASRVLAHELFHAGQRSPSTQEKYGKITELADALPENVRMTLIQDIARGVAKDRVSSTDLQSLVNQVGENAGKSGSEFAADFASFVAMGRVGESIRTEIEHMPSELADTMRVFLADHKAVIEQVIKYHELMPLPGDKTGRTIDQVMREMTKNTEEVLNSLDHINEVSKGFALMNETSPGEFQHMLATNGELPRVQNLSRLIGAFRADSSASEIVTAARRALGIEARREFEKTNGVGSRFWERLFPSAQFREAHPEIKPLLDLAYSFRGMTEDFYEKIMAPFTFDRSGKQVVDFLGRPKLDLGAHGVREVLRDVQTNELNSLMALWKQEAEMTLGDLKKAYPKLYADMTKGFSKDKVEAVEHFHQAVEQVQPLIAKLMIDMTGDTVALTGAMGLKKGDMKLATKDVMEVSRKAFTLFLEQKDLLSKGAMGTPAGLANTAALTHLMTMVGSSPYQAMMRHFEGMYADYQKVVGKLKDRPWYMSETRRGKFFVSWRDGKGVPGVAGFDSLEQVNRVIQQKKLEGFSVRTWEKTGMKPFSGADQDLIGSMSAIEKKSFEAALAHLPDGKFKDDLRNSYVPLEAISREYGSQGIAKYGLERTLAPGREYLNMAEGFFDQTQAVAFGLARRNIKEQLALWQMDRAIDSNPNLRDETNAFVRNVLDPSGKEWVAFKKLNFVYFMGANVANMITETSQPLLIFAPYMTEKSGRMSTGPKYLWAAAKMFGEALATKVTPTGKGMPMTWSDPLIHEAVQQAYRERVLDFGIAEGIGAEADSKITNLRRFAMDMSPLQKAAGAVMGPVHAYYDLVRRIYSVVPRAGSHLTFVAALKAALDGEIGGKKMGKEDAYAFAKQAVEATNFSGGTAARPMAFHNLGKLQGPVGAMYSLASYSASTLAMYARLAHDSVSMSKGLTKEQRTSAMKALGQMTFTQFALAGALGLPMSAATLAILEKLFPHEEPRKAMHEFLYNLGEKMFEDGGRFATIAERGLVNGWTGVDLSSKLLLSNMMGINATDGFSFANAVGPTGAIMENVLKAFEDTTKGNLAQGAVRLLPSAYQNIAKMFQNDGNVVDALGRKVLEPTGQQKAMLALGFKPAQLQEYYDQQKMVERAERVDEEKMRQFHTDLAKSLLQGDLGRVKGELIKKVEEDPNYDVRWGARRIAEIAQERTTPRDLYRTGNKRLVGEMERLRGMYPQTQNRPSEVERVLSRSSLEQAIGVPGTGMPSMAEIRAAAMVDAQMSQDPRLTRMGALKALQKRKPTSSSLVQTMQ